MTRFMIGDRVRYSATGPLKLSFGDAAGPVRHVYRDGYYSVEFDGAGVETRCDEQFLILLHHAPAPERPSAAEIAESIVFLASVVARPAGSGPNLLDSRDAKRLEMLALRLQGKPEPEPFRYIVRFDSGHETHVVTVDSLQELRTRFFSGGRSYFSDEDGVEPVDFKTVAGELQDPRMRCAVIYDEDGERTDINAERR